MTRNFFNRNYGFYDKLEFFLLLICLALLPLFQNFTWVSTLVILPFLSFYYLFRNKKSILTFDFFLTRYILLFVFALFSIGIVRSTDLYITEVKRLLGVILMLIIAFFSIKRNFNNIWLFYIILLVKFILMIIYTYSFGTLLDVEMESYRIQSGAEVGINANQYGYFGFVALFAVGFIYHMKRSKSILLLFILIFTASLLMTIIAASRAGTIFTIMSLVMIYLSITYSNKLNFIIKFVILSILLFLAVEFFFQNFDSVMLVKRLLGFYDSIEDSRLTILNDGLDLFFDYPITGVGSGQFPDYVWGAAPHNGFLLILINYGIFSLILYLSIFYKIFLASYNLIQNRTESKQQFGFLTFSYLMLFFMYHFFYDMPLNLYLMLMLFLVSLHLNFLNKCNIR